VLDSLKRGFATRLPVTKALCIHKEISMKKLILIAGLALCSSAYGGKITSTQITKLGLGTDNGAVLFIRAEGTKDSTPQCHNNSNFTFAMSLSSDLNKSMFSVLLAAKASGATVKLSGTSSCGVFSGIEELKYVEIK
jgi:hypothetical protein